MPWRPTSATTAVCDFSADRWKPLAPVEMVPSLLDRNGHLFRPNTKAQLIAQARLDEVELELRSQIETVLATGLTPTHLDWHAWPTADVRTSSI
jgi:predicted glycoside hydrolase/deacetylase ChbG (UPF0249 family)